MTVKVSPATFDKLAESGAPSSAAATALDDWALGETLVIEHWARPDVMAFCLEREQIERLKAWQAGHRSVDPGVIGGRYTFSFTPTSIGPLVKVRDSATGEELDLTGDL